MTDDNRALPSISQRAATGAGWIIAWRMATRNIGLLSTLVLVRLLQPSDFGLVALATGFIGSIDALSAIGIQDALVRAPKLDRDLYDTGFGLSVLRGLLTSLLVAAIAWPVGAFFNDSRLAVVLLTLSAGAVIGAFENIGIIDFRRDLAFRKEFDMQLWSRVMSVAVTITAAAVWRSYWALLAGILTYRLTRVVQSYIMSSYRPHFALQAWRRIIGFSLWVWASTVLFQIQERSESIVIGRLLGTTQIGMFAVGSELGSLPTTELVEPLGRALFSGFASLHNASQGLANMFLGAIGMGFMLILPAGVGISMIADPMVRLCLGENWMTVVPVVQIMAFGGTTAIFVHASANLLNAIGRPSAALYAGIITTIVKIVALLSLIPSFGLRGAAVALAISSIVNATLMVRCVLSSVSVRISQLAGSTVRPLIATAAMVAVLAALGMAWTPGSVTDAVSLALDAAERSAVGAICYGGVLIALWFMAGKPDGAERFALTIVNRIWKRRPHRTIPHLPRP